MAKIGRAKAESTLIIILIIVLTIFLFFELFMPSTLQIIVEEESTYLKQIHIYNLTDAVIIAVSSLLLGFLIFYMSFKSEVKPSTAINLPPDKLLKFFKGLERKIVEVLIKEGEINQAELAEKTKIPKSSLSRILVDLEWRGVVFRYNKGMSKMVKLGFKK
ncbi:MAG TPA: winged helix-turn-helix transcriptional regulator [Thermoplasmata archaeon]|nr:winged helix-turn-helix transcriptional regulator [Thermoplasmata archaeon]HIH98629.1 winged helix-turn-helix transcriptional regulator [Thermoplasmata archaeon]